RFSFDGPADTKQRCEHAAPWSRATPSRRFESHAQGVRGSFSMVETVGEHSERERLNVGHRLVPALPIRHDTRKTRDFRNPAAVILPLDLDLEVHSTSNLMPEGAAA